MSCRWRFWGGGGKGGVANEVRRANWDLACRGAHGSRDWLGFGGGVDGTAILGLEEGRWRLVVARSEGARGLVWWGRALRGGGVRRANDEGEGEAGWR